MVKTKGLGSQPESRTRPTTSIRRGDRGASSSTLVGGVDAPIGGVDAGEGVGFPRVHLMCLCWYLLLSRMHEWRTTWTGLVVCHIPILLDVMTREIVHMYHLVVVVVVKMRMS